MPHVQCSVCGKKKSSDDFSGSQVKKPVAKRVCGECLMEQRDADERRKEAKKQAEADREKQLVADQAKDELGAVPQCEGKCVHTGPLHYSEGIEEYYCWNDACKNRKRCVASCMGCRDRPDRVIPEYVVKAKAVAAEKRAQAEAAMHAEYLAKVTRLADTDDTVLRAERRGTHGREDDFTGRGLTMLRDGTFKAIHESSGCHCDGGGFGASWDDRETFTGTWEAKEGTIRFVGQSVNEDLQEHTTAAPQPIDVSVPAADLANKGLIISPFGGELEVSASAWVS